MNSTQKSILGIATIIPLIGFIYLMVTFFSFFSDMMELAIHNEEPSPEIIATTIMPMVLIGFITGLISLALTIVYIIIVVNNKQLETTERIIWILLFVFLNIIAFPIYFFMRVSGKHPEEKKFDGF